MAGRALTTGSVAGEEAGHDKSLQLRTMCGTVMRRPVKKEKVSGCKWVHSLGDRCAEEF